MGNIIYLINKALGKGALLLETLFIIPGAIENKFPGNPMRHVRSIN